MIEVKYRGRLGNNLIQYAAGVILAQKTGLRLKTEPKPTFKKAFNLTTIDGICYDDTIELTDETYFDHLEKPKPNTHYFLNGFFQHKKLLCDYRHQILDLYKLPIADVKFSSDDAFVACRFGDTLKTYRTYCSTDYVDNQLKETRHKYNKVYVTSDTITYPPLQQLIKKYDLTIYKATPIDTILFATQFNNLILSAGSFSYFMAYLSNADNVTVYQSEQDPLQKQGAWQYKIKTI
jgi:hypothetical protein